MTRKDSKMLVDSIDHTKDKHSKAQEVILEKQLDYFKERYKAINET
jgi:hypothetical protein